MWPDRVSNTGPLTYESGALPTALRGPVRAYELIQDAQIIGIILLDTCWCALI